MANNKDFKIKNGIQAVFKETLGTIDDGTAGGSIRNLTDLSDSVSTSSEETNIAGVAIKPDGTKLYVLGSSSAKITEYDLGTAFDISTATASGDTYSHSGGMSGGQGLGVSANGRYLYVSNYNGYRIYQYEMSTYWDLSTASYGTNEYLGNNTRPFQVNVSSDGKHVVYVYYGSDSNYYIRTANTNADYNITTGTLLTTGIQGVPITVFPMNYPRAAHFSEDGSYIYVMSYQNEILVYKTSTPYSIAGAVVVDYIEDKLVNNSPICFTLADSDTKFITGVSSTVSAHSMESTAKELDLSTGGVFELTLDDDIVVKLKNPESSGNVSSATLVLHGSVESSMDLANASYDQDYWDVSSKETDVTSLAFNPEGTKLFVAGTVQDDLDMATLRRAWDIGTGSYAVTFLGGGWTDLSSKESSVQGIQFNDDGSRLYFGGNGSNKIHQVDLYGKYYTYNTAAENSSTYEEYDPSEVTSNLYAFKVSDDGTKLYILKYNSYIYQYSLSTAWDISTASYDSKSLDPTGEGSNGVGFDISMDGKKLVYLSGGTDTVYLYTMSTAWDISTATYDSVSYGIGSRENNPKGIRLGNYDTLMYVFGNQNATLFQFSIGNKAHINYDSSITWKDGVAPEAPEPFETQIITFNTTDGGTTYEASVVMEGLK